VAYVGRFIPAKRHDIMKRLAIDLPAYEFVSVGGLEEAGRRWFEKFSRNLPKNYTLRTNVPEEELTQILQESRVYVHLRNESFGISPIEALASGCVPLVLNSSALVEFFPEEFRWCDYVDLRKKIVKYMESTEESIRWENRRKQLWAQVSGLGSDRFQAEMWSCLEPLV
jgi:glycosyltransferase involved in cell wall biosynthesis